MAILNASAREIEAKLVYFGTALGGKTTNLRVLHRLAEPDQKQKLVSLNTAGDRTLFFDLLPFDLGRILGWRVRFKLYSIPGQAEYAETRRVVLSAADGIVFVADSAPARHEENRRAIGFFHQNLKQNRLDAETIPLVFQHNKRDLADAMPVEKMEADLNWRRVPAFEAVALRGDGVLESFEEAAIQLLKGLLDRYGSRLGAELSPEDLRRSIGEQLAPIRRRRSGWEAPARAIAEPSSRHIVLRPEISLDDLSAFERSESKGPAAVAGPAPAREALAAPALLQAALANELLILNEVLDREAGPSPPPPLVPVLDAAQLLAAMTASIASPGLDGVAAPLLALAIDISGASGGTVLLMTAGDGPLSLAASRGVDDEPLNRVPPGGGAPHARRLALGGGPRYAEDLAASLEHTQVPGLVGPWAALPLLSGRRRAGLLVLHAPAGSPPPAAGGRAALEVVAAVLALILSVRGLERRAAPAGQPGASPPAAAARA